MESFTNIMEHLINRKILRDKVLKFNNLGTLIIKGVGRYKGQFINGEKHGKG